MPHPSKKQRLTVMEANLAEATVADQIVVTVGDLSVDVLANSFGYLGMQAIMQKRCVCKKWKEAVKMTIPPAEFRVNCMENYNAMAVMTRALPNLQQISLRDLGDEQHKYSDGEDPNEEVAARTANWTTHDIEIISAFRKLRSLEIDTAGLNGRYPFLFNSFPLLQKLSIPHCYNLKWDLEMLAGMPSLKELHCWGNECMTGNISSLRVLKDTLEKLDLGYCKNVEGNFMDLADFPHLKKLYLFKTAVTGDIREIGEDDFSLLEHLKLPHGVYGGVDYEFQRISDAPDLVRTVYLLRKQRPALEMKDWYMRLSEDSPDWYESVEDFDKPPFFISFVEAGSCIGYRWETHKGHPCEVNWLDPEPDSESSDYDEYIEKLQSINSEADFYNGFYQPPTEEEYRRLFFTG